MLTSDFLDSLANGITPLYHSFEDSVLQDIARRLSNLDFSSAAWQTQRLTESGSLYKDVLKKLSTLTGQSQAQLAETLKKAGVKAINFDDKIYKDAGLNPLPLNLSPAMLDVLKAGLEKTNGVMNNLTMSTAFTAQKSFFESADLAYLQVSTGAMSYDDAIRAAIKNAAARGLDVIDYASGHTDKLDVAMRRTVLTGVAQTANELQTTRADEMDSDLVAVSAHAGARNKGVGPANHQSWQGKIYSRSGKHKKFPNFEEITGYGTGEGLGGWNCVIGETEVSGPTALIGYRRKYSGEILTLRTARGKELTITPNHPVLTSKGWIAAGLLAQGDYVICRRITDGAAIISPNDNQSPATIEDVFSSLGENGARSVFFGSPKDFHGDGSNGKIDIVFSNSLLGNNIDPAFNQKFMKHRFGMSSRFPHSLISKSALSQITISTLHSPYGIMGGFSESGDSLSSHSTNSVTHGFRSIRGGRKSEFSKPSSDERFSASEMNSDSVFGHSAFIEPNHFDLINGEPSMLLRINPTSYREAEFIEASPDHLLTATEMAREGGFAHSALVESDQIIFIQRKFITSAHVYNLQTTKEWYYANDIITHNCRHSFYPFFENVSENAYSKEDLKDIAKKKVTVNGERIEQYDATQIQRELERKIRFWKRQAAALEAAQLENERETARIRLWQARMRDFIRQTGLDRQYVREQIL